MQADTLLPAVVTIEAAERIAAELYGISACATALPGEYDNNFWLKTNDGPGFVLKIMHPSRESALIDLQARALQHLAARAPGLSLQRVKPARNGKPISVIEIKPGVAQAVWAVGFLNGRPLAESQPKTAQLLEELGAFVGEMTAALADFDHPAAVRELKWDLTRCAWINEHLQKIADPGRRQLIARCMENFSADVLPVLPTLRHSILHGDANDYNVLTDAARSELPRIVGVIDFGDMHRGPTVAELAITIAYADRKSVV